MLLIRSKFLPIEVAVAAAAAPIIFFMRGQNGLLLGLAGSAPLPPPLHWPPFQTETAAAA